MKAGADRARPTADGRRCGMHTNADQNHLTPIMRKGIVVLLLVIQTVLLAAHFFVYETWIYFWQPAGAGWMGWRSLEPTPGRSGVVRSSGSGGRVGNDQRESDAGPSSTSALAEFAGSVARAYRGDDQRFTSGACAGSQFCATNCSDHSPVAAGNRFSGG